MTASYHETEAKSITRLPGATDPWFLGRYGMNLYRGCEHGCLYCDGRAERYHVTGEFDRDIQIKRNALEVLRRELARRREPGFVLLGGGVCDSYQPAEQKYQLARGVLELCLTEALPVHLLTKSALVERDLDLLARIAERSRVILSFSIAMLDEELRQELEPVAAPLSDRWRLLRQGKALGLATGVMAMPLLPGLSDQPAEVSRLVGQAKENGVDFVCLGGLTLRPGIQQQTYIDRLAALRPDLLSGYQRLYRAQRRSGAPDSRYLERLEGRCRAALAEHRMPGRPPWELFRGRLPLYAELGVLLEHRGFEEGERPWAAGSLGRAGWAIQGWARERLARTRRKGAYRDVEGELAELVREGRLGALLGLPAPVVKAVEEILERLLSSRPDSFASR